ncbi:hypothetical protein JCM10296v2_005377 [Rhodotorula toruloides]
MPALAPRQAATPTTASSSSQANTDGTRFIPSQTGSPDNGNQSSGTTFDIWKYIVVIVLACFALTVFIRLCLVQRLRRNRLLAFQVAEDRRHAERRARRQRERDLRRVESRGSSVGDSVYEREVEDEEVPPPAYDQTVQPAPPPATASTPPAQARPTPFSRLSSLFKRQPPAPSPTLSTPAVPLQPLPPPSSSTAPPPSSSNPNHAPSPSTLAQVTELRRNLRAFAGSGMGRRGSTAGEGGLGERVGGASPAVLASAATALALSRPDDDERRRAERRARRRERRRREREREEGLGLPVYSKEVGEGEEVLQRAEGAKLDSEGESSGSEEESEEEGEGRERRESVASGSGTATAAMRVERGSAGLAEADVTDQRRDAPT